MDKETLLLVEDSQANVVVYSGYLAEKYNIKIAYDGEQALSLFSEKKYAVVLLDVQLPDMSGLDVLQSIREQDSDTPVIIMTAHGSVDVALDAMRFGANDFLSKPFDKARLLVTINNILKERELKQIVNEYEKSCDRHSLKKMIGSSLAMQNVYNIIESSATSRATVFITGESGTGKELCAEAIHQCSERAKQAFVALNCAAIPHDLLESEIFGHLKGAFTGASAARQGAASRADGGTLFFDEIGEMPLALQSKLLRFIQTGCFQPVGSSKEIQVDIRIICATNREPLEEVRNGRFREDLYYRLNVIPIEMPPLRKRNKDVMEVAIEMLTQISKEEKKSFSSFEPMVERLFLTYPWPGNVRQLSNVIRNIVVLNIGEQITLDMLPAPLDNFVEQATVSSTDGDALKTDHIEKMVVTSPAELFEVRDEQDCTPENDSLASEIVSQESIQPLWQAEKKVIEQAILACNGNIPKAAAFLEISASTIYRKKQAWEEKS
jgi:two-component system repressor protein LuxO